MTTRKNKSVRLSDDELAGLAKIRKGTPLTEAALIQRAVRKFISDYKKSGRAILFDSEEDVTEPASDPERAAIAERASRQTRSANTR